MLDKAVDCSEPAIASYNAIVTDSFKMVEKSEDVVGVNVIKAEESNRTAATLGQEAEQQPECVAIGEDRVLAGSPEPPKIFGEERFNETEQRIDSALHR